MAKFTRFLVVECVLCGVLMVEHIWVSAVKDRGLVSLGTQEDAIVVFGVKVLQRGTEFALMSVLVYMICLKTASKDMKLRDRLPTLSIPVLCPGSGWCANRPLVEEDDECIELLSTQATLSMKMDMMEEELNRYARGEHKVGRRRCRPARFLRERGRWCAAAEETAEELFSAASTTPLTLSRSAGVCRKGGGSRSTRAGASATSGEGTGRTGGKAGKRFPWKGRWRGSAEAPTPSAGRPRGWFGSRPTL